MTAYKKRLLVLASILSFLVLVAYSAYHKYNQFRNEKEWFASNLHYNFSARVDSALVFHSNGNGFVLCSITSGKVNLSLEDSLNRHLRHYAKLKFLRTTNDGRIRIFSGVTDIFHSGDSVCFNSEDDSYQYFRKGQLLRKYSISESILEQHF